MLRIVPACWQMSLTETSSKPFSRNSRIADRVIVLHQGKLIEQGESARILSEPGQEQTKRFLEFYGV